MKILPDYVLQLPATLRRERLLARVGSHANLDVDESQTTAIGFFDSLDRDLWFAQRALYQADHELVAATLENLLLSEPIAKCAFAGTVPKFSWELPDTPVRKWVAEALELRAVLPLVRIIATTVLVHVKNDDQKTVVRLRLPSISSTQDQSQTILELCCVQPVRGYEAEARQLADDLLELGLYPADSMVVARFVGELAAVPEIQTGKHSVSVDPTQNSREAVCTLVRDLGATAWSREAGIIDDIDTEFLHEYRVALRRTRSLIALSKGVFPLELTVSLKDGFRQLASATNRLRDLDVYLLSQQPYRELVPANLQAGLEEMFGDFKAERGREQLAVRERLTANEYRRAVESLERLLDAAERSPASRVARLPVVQLASRIMGKRYKKTISRAKAVDESTPAEAVHELRIGCKKLRYSLEFFGTLFEQDGVAVIVKQLKRLQDTLGVLNDLSLQQSSLAGYLKEKQSSDASCVVLAASIGGLIGVLHQRQIDQRSKVAAQIVRFCSADVAAMFDRICRPVKRIA